MNALRTVAVLATTGLLLAGCGRGNNTETAQLRSQVAALQQRLDTTSSTAPPAAEPTSSSATTTSTTMAPTTTTISKTDLTVAAMTRWMAFHAHDMETVTAVSTTVGHLTHPIDLMYEDCQNLVGVVRGAREGLPVPELTVSTPYSKALGIYEQAGLLCSQPSSGDIIAMLAQVQSLVGSATPLMSQAEQALVTYISIHHL